MLRTCAFPIVDTFSAPTATSMSPTRRPLRCAWLPSSTSITRRLCSPMPRGPSSNTVSCTVMPTAGLLGVAVLPEGVGELGTVSLLLLLLNGRACVGVAGATTATAAAAASASAWLLLLLLLP